MSTILSARRRSRVGSASSGHRSFTTGADGTATSLDLSPRSAGSGSGHGLMCVRGPCLRADCGASSADVPAFFADEPTAGRLGKQRAARRPGVAVDLAGRRRDTPALV